MSSASSLSESWSPVVGYEGYYEVSSWGRVRAVERTVMRRHNKTDQLVRYTYRAQPIRAWIGSDTGYQMVTLTRDNKKRSFSIHTLVLEAFVGPRPAGHVGCHGDNDRANPHLNNLRWGTHESNEADKLVHGTRPLGADVHNAKLTAEDVRTIRARLALGTQRVAIARDYGITPEAVSAIKTGKNWGWLA